jgi:eukaryotic-like serine/threonine-protein kinase
MPNEDASLSALLNEFEALWKSGANPELDSFLARVPEAKRIEAARLLNEIMDRGSSGDNPTVQQTAPDMLHGNNTARVSGDGRQDLAARRRTKTGHPPDVPRAEVIGPYKLRQRIGQGGMGEVWMAEQEQPVRRVVALKLIKQGIDNRQVIARFEAERQALALMDHQNIAKVFDAGTTPDGQPYFVMELVKGVPLTKYCDENQLTIDQRLKLFIDVCAGVQHAHQKGIIHRDLKPTNIIVGQQDGQPVPKVIDFGLAKAIESTQRLSEQSVFTGIGQILGTIKYMSPEQASLDNLDIDTRTDIYALGVILYELLTGSTPLDEFSIKGQAALKLLELIRDKEPIKPSSRLGNTADQEVSSITNKRRTDSVRLNRILAGDLDWIVMKALEKDRTRRYESASGFAADVHRYLNSEPVIARPPSWSYRLHKFVSKHRVSVVSASLISLALIGGVVGTSLALARALKAEQEAIDAREQEFALRQLAVAAQQLAESRRQEAEQNLTFARKGNFILGSVFANLDPAAEYSEVSELRDALRANLSQATNELQGSAIGDPLEVAEMQSILGRSLAGLGEPQLAIEIIKKVFETRKSMLGLDHPRTISSMGALGANYERAGKLDQAVLLLEDALARCKSLNGPDHEDTLSHMNNLALAYRGLGGLDKAVALLEEALRLKREKYGIDDLESLSVVGNLASCYVDMGLFDQAMPLLEHSYGIRKAQLGPDHPSTLTSLNNLAMTYQKTGDLAKALPMLEDTLALRKARLGPDHPATFASMSHLARAFSKSAQPAKARMLYEESLKLRQAKLGADHPDTLNNMNNLGAIYHELGMMKEALPLLDEAFSRAKDKLGADHSTTLACMNNLFRYYRKANQPDRALPILEVAFNLRKAKLGLDHPDTVTTMNSLANYYNSLGKYDQALPLFEQSLELTKSKQGGDHSDTLEAINELADCYTAAGQLDKGLLLYEQALEIKKTKFGSDDTRTVQSMSRLGISYLDASHPDKAIPLLQQALNLKGIKYAADDASTLRSLFRLARAYMANGQADKAVPLFEQTMELRKATVGVEHRSTLEAMSGLLGAYAQVGHAEKYLGLLETAITQWRNSLPANSAELAANLSTAGMQLLQLQKFSEADKLLRESLKIGQENQPEAWKTFNTQSLLGAAVLSQSAQAGDDTQKADRLVEAETLLIKGFEGMQQQQAAIPADEALRLPEALDRLIELYSKLEKPNEAQKYRNLRATYPPAAGN